MNLLLPGLYVATGSVLHRLDPRMKMGAALLLMTIPFAARSLGSNLLLLAFVTGVVFLSSVPLLALLRTLGTILWIGLFMFVFYFFTTPGRPLLALGGITVTWEGLLAGLTQIYRMAFLVIVASLLTFATSPGQMAHGLEAMLGPLTRLGLPVRELAMVVTIALRFVPALFEEVEKITMAQQARGADIRGGRLWHRIRSWGPVFIPIFVSAFRRADDLATAMEARGFRGTHRRTHLVHLRLTHRDLVASLVVLVVMLAVVGLERLT